MYVNTSCPKTDGCGSRAPRSDLQGAAHHGTVHGGPDEAPQRRQGAQGRRRRLPRAARAVQQGRPRQGQGHGRRPRQGIRGKSDHFLFFFSFLGIVAWFFLPQQVGDICLESAADARRKR